MIRAGDRVARVLERDGRLVDVFAAASPHFERLRSPAMRKVMARLVTVEQAARIAGVEVGALLERLNRAAGETTDGGAEEAPADPTTNRNEMSTTEGRIPAALAAIPAERVVDLDVREDLRNGQEPFARIMAAKQALTDGQVLRLRAIFEPVPLYHVMRKQGYDHWTERLADDDWRVWFHPAGDADPAPAAPAGRSEPVAVPETGAGEEVVVLDVRGMEPPEPMVRTLAALESLPAGATLLQINVRVPQFLLPKLEGLGYVYEVREQNEELVRVFIRRR